MMNTYVVNQVNVVDSTSKREQSSTWLVCWNTSPVLALLRGFKSAVSVWGTLQILKARNLVSTQLIIISKVWLISILDPQTPRNFISGDKFSFLKITF